MSADNIEYHDVPTQGETKPVKSQNSNSDTGIPMGFMEMVFYGFQRFTKFVGDCCLAGSWAIIGGGAVWIFLTHQAQMEADAAKKHTPFDPAIAYLRSKGQDEVANRLKALWESRGSGEACAALFAFGPNKPLTLAYQTGEKFP